MGLMYSVYSAIFGQTDDGQPDPGTGLTLKEKEAITSSWALLSNKKVLRENAIEFFLILFEEYPYMKLKFHALKDLSPAELGKNKTMNSHALTVMYSISSLVDNLDDVEQLVLLITKIGNSHLSRGVGYSAFKDLATMFPKFLDARAGSAATPFVKQSWDKFLGVMNALVQQMEQERRT